MDFAALLQPDRGQVAIEIQLVDTGNVEAWLLGRDEATRTLIAANRFTGSADTLVVLPASAGGWTAVAGVADTTSLTPWCLATAASRLPEGSYRLPVGEPGAAALGWLLAQHRFDRYRKDDDATGPRTLLTGNAGAVEEAVAQAEAVALVRDMVNTPAADMGPAELEAQSEALAASYAARLTVTRGSELEVGYPMIHAVGMAAERSRAPRLIELEWGDPAQPRVAIVGKGVCFDSGGLDIKPSAGMRLMKKDMGGAAHALALAGLIMRAKLPVRLHLLIPAVENAIAGNAFRPGDVLTSRKGLTVEIGNTDAEGRLVLADALTKAVEDKAGLIVDFATLTGAARVALGPDLPATFANDDALAAQVLDAATRAHDPLWRMPLHAGYDAMLKSDIADLNNAPEGGFAGAVTAALFLQRFVPVGTPWLHLDTFAWQPVGKAGRPKGGDALGLRAVWAMLQERHDP